MIPPVRLQLSGPFSTTLTILEQPPRARSISDQTLITLRRRTTLHQATVRSTYHRIDPPHANPSLATSSGGYGSPPEESWSDRAQRGFAGRGGTGLINQSLSGGDLADEAEDAVQGSDKDARRDFQRAGGKGLDPYGDTNPDSKDEARAMLASQYASRRNDQYEGSGTKSNDGDVGT